VDVQGPFPTKKVLRKDPLVLVGLAILIAGVVLTAYGYIPQNQANYVQSSTGAVPLTDPEGNFIVSPDVYYQSHYTGTAVIDKVECSPSINGYICYGFQFVGYRIVYSISSREYGLIMMVLGVIGIYAGNRLAPPKAKEPHLRPITIRVDEDVCVANGICIRIAPNVFQLKKQEAPTIFAPMVYVVDPYGADNDTIIEAAIMCPTAALVIEDAETGERIHPPYPEN
jgi:ferredoxin